MAQPRLAAWWPIVPIVCVAAMLYSRRMADTPAYIGGDEARFATAARAIASTGRDLNGERLPLFFHMTDSEAANDGSTRWYQPVLFYLMAAAFRVAPMTESSMRVPTLAVALLDVWLMFVCARLLFSGTFYPAVAATALVLTPAHLIFGRQSLDYICTLPFILGWLACLASHADTGRTSSAFAAGLLLGLGFYSYIAAWILMPACLMLTWIVQYRAHPGKLGLPAVTAAGFALPLIALVPWLWQHPQMLSDTIGRYNVYDVHRLSPLQGAKDFLNYNNVQERISVYWDYFNPAFLFFTGGSNLTTSTRRAGVFPVAFAVCIPLGLYALWQKRGSPMSIVLLAGFALAPLPATLVDERYAIQRALVLVPFGALIAIVGVQRLRDRAGRLAAAASVMLLIAVPVQYAFFYRDYFDGYRARSAYWFDPIDFRDVAEYLIATDASRPLPAVYLSRNLDDVAPRWRFFLAKHGREDLASRTTYFSPNVLDAGTVQPGALLVFDAGDPGIPRLLAGGCAVAMKFTGIGGNDAAVILLKRG
jgi:4-amino-4-deoxy-L-arabinose transferase-like glycosyltransferase